MNILEEFNYDNYENSHDFNIHIKNGYISSLICSTKRFQPWWEVDDVASKLQEYFGKDKKAWEKWWESQGHKPVDKKYLEPWKSPDSKK